MGCRACGASCRKNKQLCSLCEDAFWVQQPIGSRPWSWSKNYAIRRDNATCQHCGRKRQNFNHNSLVLRNLRRELGRELTNEETALVLGVPVEDLYIILTVHHVLPRSEGGLDNPENLLTLCRPCHDKVHHQQPKGRHRKKKE
jgi:5-methylcytosine-specific restriction endonuclease McrA